MEKRLFVYLFALLLLFISNCAGQELKTTVQSEADIQRSAFYQGMPEKIMASDTSLAWKQDGQRLLITGIIYQADGRTPARDVILYYYHTNLEGRYIHKANEQRSMLPQNGITHGYIRGWVKTDEDGKYSMYTVRPGSYPVRKEPAHIHVTLLEPGGKPYYIDEFVFDDDKLLNGVKRKAMENRGGSGVLRLLQKGDLLLGERNIILGLNIPNHPKKSQPKINSGKEIGEDILSFTPYHAWGSDKGSKACPICKYGRYHGILYFVGNNLNWEEIKKWLIFFEKESVRRKKFLKVYFIYGNENGFAKAKRIHTLEQLGRELNLKKVALTFVPSFDDKESEIYLNKINPNVENTILIYRHSNVIDKYINLKPNEDNFRRLSKRLTETRNEFFDLVKPKSKNE